MSKIRGGKVKSIAGLKSSLKKGGGAGYLTRVSADSVLTVRFLTEPDDGWVQYFEHYDDVRKFYPCTDDCPGCREGDQPSMRYLANALDVAEGRVVPLVMPKTLAQSAMKKYEKYGTLLDRDYEIERSGSGFETTYEITPEPPSRMNLSRFDTLELWEILEGQLSTEDSDDAVDEDDDDGTDEELAAMKAKFKAASKAAEVDEDDEDDDDGPNTRESLADKSLRELRAIAQESGASVEDVKGLDVDALVDLIIGEDDEEPEAAPDSDGLTEDEVKEMSLAEVKAIAKNMKIKFAPGTSKEDLIEMIFDTPPF